MELLQKILNLDTELFLFLNSFHNQFWDYIMLMITRKETWLPFFLVILFLIIKNYRAKSVLIIIMLSVTILMSDQLSVLLKETIQRLRPVYDPQIDNLVHNVFRKGGLYGFVSSHAANSFAIFYFTHRLFRNKGYSFLLFFWALLMSYSRIYLGVHYPLDILGGAVLGWLTGLITYKILMFIEVHFFLTGNPKIYNTNLKPAQSGLLLFVFCMIIVTAITVLYILEHYSIL